MNQFLPAPLRELPAACGRPSVVVQLFVRRVAVVAHTAHAESIEKSASNTRYECDDERRVWPGLAAWRSSQKDGRICWGEKGPCETADCGRYGEFWGDTGRSRITCSAGKVEMETLAEYGRRVLLTSDPFEKAALTHKAWEKFCRLRLEIGVAEGVSVPKRPQNPELVPAKEIPPIKRSPLPANVYVLHNLAHVELNAIDLAWDTVVRFSDMCLPTRFYADFAKVADDESRHLGWCLQRLDELGHSYGDMPAHNLLWEGCIASSKDVRERLAVVPMSQEARGLDAGEGWLKSWSAGVIVEVLQLCKG